MSDAQPGGYLMRWFLFRLACSGLFLCMCVPFPCLGQDWNGTVGDDVMTVGSGETYDNVRGDDGGDTITNYGTVNTYLRGDDGNDIITNYGTVGSRMRGDPGDDTIINYGTVGYIDSGTGDDTITNHGTVLRFIFANENNDIIYNYGTVERNIEGGSGDDVIWNYGTAKDDLWGQTGGDNIYNYGRVLDNIESDADNDVIFNAPGAYVGGHLYGYSGDDVIYNYGTVGEDVQGGFGNDVVYLFASVGTEVYGDSFGGANDPGTSDLLYVYGGVAIGTDVSAFETIHKLGVGSVSIGGTLTMDSADFNIDMYEAESPFVLGSGVAGSGTDLAVAVKGGHWRNGQMVNIFSTGAVTFTGTETVASASPLFSFTSNNAQITAARGSYSQVIDPSNVNARRLVPLLDTLANTASGDDWDAFFSNLDFLPAGRMEDAVNQLGPSLTGAMQGQALHGQRLLGAALASRPAPGAGVNPGGFTLCVTGAGGAATESGGVDPAAVRAFNEGVAQVFDGDWDANAVQAFAGDSALGRGGVLVSAVSGLSESEAMGPSMSLTSRDMGYWLRLVGGQEFNEDHDGFPGSTAYTMGVAGGVDFGLDDRWT